MADCVASHTVGFSKVIIAESDNSRINGSVFYAKMCLGGLLL